MNPVLVVGGGPAGLAAAIAAAGNGNRVVLLEKNRECGRKLLATGGGHANLGNLLPMREWPGRFGKHGRFITPALARLPTEKYRAWLAGIGVPTTVVDGFHFYPESNQAKQVRDALVAEAIRLGVDIRYGKKADSLAFDGAHGLFALQADGESLAGRAAILACGGKSYPALGSNGDGYALAQRLGHRIRVPVPALVGLRAKEWNSDLAGIVFPHAEVRFRAKGKKAESGVQELLLTHGGVSGPAVLDLSGEAVETLSAGLPASLEIRWLAGMGAEEWRKTWAQWRQAKGASQCGTALKTLVPARFAAWLCRLAGMDEKTPVARMGAKETDRLVAMLSSFRLDVADSEGWEKAFVTRGGVVLSEIDPKTLSSRLVPRLSFAGEVPDVDGPCGGFNLHWAFASGALAGSQA